MARAVRRLRQGLRPGCGDEECRDVGCAIQRAAEIRRIAAGDGDRNGCLPLAADQQVEMLQPFLVEAADADIDPRQRADDADRIGAVMQHMRHLHPGLGARQVEIAPGKHLLGADLQPRAELIDRIHGARIVDVVGCQRRGVDGAWRHRVHHLEQEAVLLAPQHEDACRPEILGSDVARQVFPAWMLRIGRGMQRMRPDMAEAAGHADPVRPDQRRSRGNSRDRRRNAARPSAGARQRRSPDWGTAASRRCPRRGRRCARTPRAETPRHRRRRKTDRRCRPRYRAKARIRRACPTASKPGSFMMP